MKVLPLDSHLEPAFWKHVYQDIPDHYFFILDMKHNRASTKILLALNEENCIEGMMMIFEERIVQLRGSVEAAKAILAELDIEKVEIQGLVEHKALILEKFKKAKRTLELILMTLRRGEETLHIKHPVVRLSTADAEDIAALMKHGDPEWWGEATAKKIADKIRERLWLGIKVNDQLASIGGATIDDWGSNIGTVVTHETHRNKGYATSIVSALVDRILQKTNLVLVHVESDNAPAVRAYTKVGFKPYRTYFVARAEKP
ncbi:MAG: GNAT family N-acetyltransferase [Candidatus Bathyarchaeota archaeon]|nr:GNAT family N-acetyltransferase [Candidatus Bathyarchaeota archaeon]